jgi:hypothetical protein
VSGFDEVLGLLDVVAFLEVEGFLEAMEKIFELTRLKIEI